MKIKIDAGGIELVAQLLDTETGRAVWEALPFEGRASVWGDEIYFSIPVNAKPEPGAQDEVAVGDLAYWPPGNAFCLFFGPTPASLSTEPRAASPVNVFGKIEGDATVLKKYRRGKVKVERLEA